MWMCKWIYVLFSLLSELQYNMYADRIVVSRHYFVGLIADTTKLYRKRLFCCTHWNALISEFYTNERYEPVERTFGIEINICWKNCITSTTVRYWLSVCEILCVCVCQFPNALNNAEMNILNGADIWMQLKRATIASGKKWNMFHNWVNFHA